jgi:hypothetical protein
MKRKMSRGAAMVALASCLCLSAPSAAGVLQRVTAVQGSTPLIDPLDPFPQFFTVPPDLLSFGSFATTDQQQVFAATSAEISTNVLAQVAGFNGFGPFSASAAAGAFGNVGLASRMVQEVATGVFSGARVLIASDEFVNVTGAPQSAVARFIVDGGLLAGAQASYRLVVGARNLGNAALTTELDDLELLIFLADNLFFFDTGFASQGSLRTQGGVSQYSVFNNPSATETSDLGAAFDPANRRVDIPLSLQSFDLGVLNPGDRLLLFYSLYLETAAIGGPVATASFSDPLTLAGNVNFPTVVFRDAHIAAPEASALSLLVVGLACLCLRRRLAERRALSPRGHGYAARAT